MKHINVPLPRPYCFALSLLLLCLFAATSLPARAQDARLKIGSLDRLASKAATSVNVNIDGFLLQQAAKFLSGKDPEEAKVKDMIAGIKESTSGALSSTKRERIRKQTCRRFVRSYSENPAGRALSRFAASVTTSTSRFTSSGTETM
jgi:hypothetical protein